MKNRIYISIVDQDGLKQFNFHKVAKRIFFYALISLVVLIISGFLLMTYLMKQVQDISITKNELAQKYKTTFYQNQDLKENISSKSQELIDITKRVDDIQDIINLSKNTDIPIQYDNQALQATSEQKKLLLQIIPNGSPVFTTAKISSVKLRPHPSKGIYGVDSGIDYILPLKTPIYATADGIVELARSGTRGYGKFIKLTHAYGFSSMYAHLLEYLVKKGDFVRKGQIIGYSGNSGNSNGARLYYEIRFLGGYQNALDYTQWGEENFDDIFKKQTHVHWDKLLWAIDDLRQIKSHLNNNEGNNV